MAPLPEQFSQYRRRRAQAYEYSREARDEQERGDENVAPRLRLALVDQRFDARAREVAKIGRRERQHARRNKRDEARAERDGKGDVGHGVTNGPSTATRQMLPGARSLASGSGDAATGLIGRRQKRPREGARARAPVAERSESPSAGRSRRPASRRPAVGEGAQSSETGEHQDPCRGLRHRIGEEARSERGVT